MKFKSCKQQVLEFIQFFFDNNCVNEKTDVDDEIKDYYINKISFAIGKTYINKTGIKFNFFSINNVQYGVWVKRTDSGISFMRKRTTPHISNKHDFTFSDSYILILKELGLTDREETWFLLEQARIDLV